MMNIYYISVSCVNFYKSCKLVKRNFLVQEPYETGAWGDCMSLRRKYILFWTCFEEDFEWSLWEEAKCQKLWDTLLLKLMMGSTFLLLVWLN